MHVDDERGQFALGSGELGVHGRVVEAVSLLSVRGLPGEHLGRGDEGGGHFGLGRGTQHLGLATRHLDDRGSVRRGVREEDDAAIRSGDVADGPPAGRPLLGHAVVDAHGADMPDLVLGPRAHEVVVVVVVVGMQAELPVRVRECARSRVQRASAQTRSPRVQVLALMPHEALRAVQVCPARGVIHVDEIAVKRPARLVDAHARAIHQDDLLIDGALEGQGRDAQLRVRPRHVRVVPGDPGNLGAVGGDRRCLSEVGALEDGDDRTVVAGGGAIERNRDDLVDRLARGGVILGHRVHQLTHVGDPEVAVADLRQSRQRTYNAAWIGRIKGVDATVVLIGEHDDAMVNGVCLAAVLVNARADIGQARTVDERQDLARFPRTTPAQQRRASALARMPLDPVGVGSVDANLGQRDRTGGEGITRNGGLPQAVGCDGDGHSASLSGTASQHHLS